MANASAAKDFTLADFHSATQLVSLNDFEGKVVLFRFLGELVQTLPHFFWVDE